MVLGAWLGGFEGAQRIAAPTEPEIPAIGCVILDVDTGERIPPVMLVDRAQLPARHACHGEARAPARIDVAPSANTFSSQMAAPCYRQVHA